MKKIVSILLVAVMLLSLCMVNVCAELLFLYEDRFLEEFGEITFYSEEYYQYKDIGNGESDIDWVLVHAASDVMIEPIENPTTNYYEVGDVLLGSIYIYDPFVTGYAIYDVSKDEFLDITTINIDDYNCLRKVLSSGRYGRLIGDVDSDNELSILDATEIQCILAQLSSLNNFYITDFDRDGTIGIMDATAIQMKLAKLD